MEAKRLGLPSAPTAFVGRLSELRGIRLELDRSRLVTLTSPGGCGKTRLALECARQLADVPVGRRYANRAAWCDLAPVTDPAHVPERLLDGLALAIDLAAARIKMLSLAQIVEPLDDAFALLTRGSPTGPPDTKLCALPSIGAMRCCRPSRPCCGDYPFFACPSTGRRSALVKSPPRPCWMRSPT